MLKPVRIATRVERSTAIRCLPFSGIVDWAVPLGGNLQVGIQLLFSPQMALFHEKILSQMVISSLKKEKHPAQLTQKSNPKTFKKPPPKTPQKERMPFTAFGPLPSFVGSDGTGVTSEGSSNCSHCSIIMALSVSKKAESASPAVGKNSQLQKHV